MPSVIDQRLASTLHLVQIERLLRVEGIADDVERLVRRAFAELVKAAKHPQANFQNAFPELVRHINVLLANRFQRLAIYAHDSTVDAYARAIPRQWLRRANPAQILAGEDVLDLGPGLADFDNPAPTADGRISDAEWADYLKKTIFEPPPPARVEQIILRPVNGFSWPQRVESLSRLVQDPAAVLNNLRDGYAAGETLDQLTRRMMPLADNWASSARRIARTEGMRIANEIQRETYSGDALGPLMAGVQIVATLDERTRPEHRLWHGRIYWYDQRKRPTIGDLPSLPAGPNCRCMDVPVLRPPKEVEADPAIRADYQTATGDMIPDPSAYSDWFRQADIGRRKMAVGSTRYKTVQRLLGGADPQWADFIGPDGDLMTVDKLRGETQRQRDSRVAKVTATIAQRMDLLGQVSRFGFVSRPPKPGRK